jgi:hypothetical protein
MPAPAPSQQREFALLQSYKRMGMNPKNVEGYRGALKRADEMRLKAMDPNASKGMSPEERSFYVNYPNMLTQVGGGFEADWAWSGMGRRKKREEEE